MGMDSMEVVTFRSVDFGQIRTLLIDNEPWFVGKDVASALGYKDSINALKSHVDNEDKRGWQITTTFGKQTANIINESGLYSLILGSKLESAKKFKKWVTSEVLPSIRKNGGYIANQEELSEDEIIANALLVAHKIIARKEQRIAEMQPKADWYDKVADSSNLTEIGTVGKITGVGEKRIFKKLIQDGIIRKKCDSDGVSYYVPYYGYDKYFTSIPEPFIRGDSKLVRNKLLFNQQGVIWATERYKV